MGAEIHMIVRSHGPARWDDPEALLSQMSTFQGYCTPASSLGVGTDESAFSCFEPQATMHMPETSITTLIPRWYRKGTAHSRRALFCVWQISWNPGEWGDYCSNLRNTKQAF